MPVYQQGDDARAKQSTRFVGRGVSAVTSNVDDSHYFTNLSTNVTYCFEASTTRFNYSHPRTILVRAEFSNTDTGILFRHGSGANTETLAISAANTARLQVANAVIWTQTLSVLTGSDDEIVIAWVTRANPDTTGAGDAVISDVMVWNVTTPGFERFRVVHAAKALQAGATAVWGASTHPAGVAFSGTITGFLYEARAMSATEIASEWYDTLVAPSTTVVATEQGLPVLESSGIGDVGYFHGPAAQWATDATRRMYRRLSSPLVNEALRIRTTWQSTTLTGPFWRGIPGASTWRTHVTWLRECIVPETCTHLWVRAHVRTWTTSGSAAPLGVRIYTANKRFNAGGEPLALYYGEEIVTRDDDASVGNWAINEVIPVARSANGLTYVMVAFRIDPNAASANDANERFALNAINVVPCLADPDGGLQFGEMP